MQQVASSSQSQFKDINGIASKIVEDLFEVINNDDVEKVNNNQIIEKKKKLIFLL